MKVKKPSGQTVKDTAALAGGAIAGSMASRAVFGFMHTPTAAPGTDEAKKEENMALLKRAALVGAGVAGALFIDGKDAVTTLVKGVGVGMAVEQSLAIIKTLAVKGGVQDENTAGSTGKKVLARAVGLGCPCDGSAPVGMGFIPAYAYSGMDTFEDRPVRQMNTSLNGPSGWGTNDLEMAI